MYSITGHLPYLGILASNEEASSGCLSTHRASNRWQGSNLLGNRPSSCHTLDPIFMLVTAPLVERFCLHFNAPRERLLLKRYMIRKLWTFGRPIAEWKVCQSLFFAQFPGFYPNRKVNFVDNCSKLWLYRPIRRFRTWPGKIVDIFCMLSLPHRTWSSMSFKIKSGCPEISRWLCMSTFDSRGQSMSKMRQSI